jgi:hypothetical protein
MALINKDTRLDLIRRLEDENPNDANLMDEATALAFIESMTPMNNSSARPGSAVLHWMRGALGFLPAFIYFGRLHILPAMQTAVRHLICHPVVESLSCPQGPATLK